MSKYFLYSVMKYSIFAYKSPIYGTVALDYTVVPLTVDTINAVLYILNWNKYSLQRQL